MEEMNELLERALVKLDDLVEVIEDLKSVTGTHKETMDDVLYELQEVRTTIEDQIEE